MPIGIQRLNAKKSHPNPNIVFIKPLPGPNETDSRKFLERIAAQCLPVMRKHHVSVTSLEEYEPNREFLGRNFNAGEVIQLVLRSPRTGRWLPFEYVQMVMMHELAHCKQMNHSKEFWAVRNQYAAQMYGLWREGYMGDGIWGRGANLATGEWERNRVQSDEVLLEHLCGGTYRSRRRKRKARSTLTYQELKQRRILKKFGDNGMVLGADEDVKVKLEKGKRVQAKPRVAGSARGRELRAAAALARFEQQKVEVKDEVTEKQEVGSTSSSGEESDDESVDADLKGAVDVDGTRLVDRKGRAMVKVCDDEDTSDPDARNELSQLQVMFSNQPTHVDHGTLSKSSVGVKDEQRESEPVTEISIKSDPDDDLRQRDGPSVARAKPVSVRHEDRLPPIPTPEVASSFPLRSTCIMCSFKNGKAAVTCSMCANVLSPDITLNTWRCTSSLCKNSQYVNSGDCGVCGLCGQKQDV